MSQIESTYKSLDVEETIDLYFYRPIGYVIAKACRKLGITPNTVTVISIFIGVTGGYLLYFRDLTLNALGFLLWVIADTLDSVDGQLARMTNHRSKLGRILDGFGGNLMFMSMYLSLYARMLQTYDVAWIWPLLLVAMSGLSHSLQSSLADYYRNAYLKFVVDPQKSELEGSAEVRSEYEALSFRSHPFRKALLRLYLNYTIQQEALSRNFQLLRRTADREFGQAFPRWLSDEYRVKNKPLIKYYNVLTTNTRMIVMSVCVLSDHVVWYFIAEILAFNALMILVTRRQEWLSAELLELIEQKAQQSA